MRPAEARHMLWCPRQPASPLHCPPKACVSGAGAAEGSQPGQLVCSPGWRRERSAAHELWAYSSTCESRIRLLCCCTGRRGRPQAGLGHTAGARRAWAAAPARGPQAARQGPKRRRIGRARLAAACPARQRPCPRGALSRDEQAVSVLSASCLPERLWRRLQAACACPAGTPHATSICAARPAGQCG